MPASHFHRYQLAVCVLALAISGTVFTPVLARAGAPDEAICDRLAAVPFDADKPSGVDGSDQIAAADRAEALRSCEAAAQASGAPRRLWMQYGRALETAGRNAEALAAYEKAAGQGSTAAMIGLSGMYSSGKGVAQDYAKAMSWIRKAAEAGDPVAMNNLAAMYAMGEGMETNFAEASRWYEKAAATGLAEAMYELGRLNRDGLGGLKDIEAAKAWFGKAAAQDHPDALYSLGVMEAKAKAGSKEREEAKRHLARAAELGVEEAAAALHRLNCPFTLKSKDGKESGEICIDGPVLELRRTTLDGKE
jgi:TPR repeat protein